MKSQEVAWGPPLGTWEASLLPAFPRSGFCLRESREAECMGNTPLNQPHCWAPEITAVCLPDPRAELSHLQLSE